MTAAARESFIKRNRSVLLAFGIPIVILVLIYIGREIYPFGEEMYLRSDMYHQYAPFLKLFQSILKNGGSLQYTWNIGLGSNFLSTYAYYLASPLNWITVILPSNHIPEIMSCFIIFKTGLMSATMTYYLNQHFRRTDLLSACFGIFFGLSAYMAAYSWNLMWLDCLVLLPLLVLGLERLVTEGRVVLYTICFALSVLSNYYIAIMLCIFTVFYFIYLIVAKSKARGSRNILRLIGRYVLYTALGGCMGAAVFFPAFLTLFGTASADSSFPTQMRAYFNILEMFAHGAMNTKVTMMEGYVPNIYCGVLAFAAVPLYWMNRTIPIRERAGKTVLLVILIFSFAFNIPAYIWHGFHFPNSLPARHSFIYIFLILTIGYEVFLRIRSSSYRQIGASFAIGITALFALQVLYAGDDYPLSIAYVSAAFLAGGGIAALLLKHKKRLTRSIAVFVLLALCVAESAVNMEHTGYSTTSRTNYVEDNETIDLLLNGIEDTDFYRVEKLERRTKNDGAWSGYRSASVFSSVTSKALSDFYESLGMQSGTNSFSYYGNTALSSALLGVRYRLTSKEASDPLMEYVNSVNGMTLYRCKYTLPLGFMVNTTTQAEVNLTDDDPFMVQNDFIEAAADAAPVFQESGELTGHEIRYQAEEAGIQYFFVQNKMKDLTISKTGGEGSGSQIFSSLEGSMIVCAGAVSAGQEFTLTTSDSDVTDFTVIPAVLDEAALSEAIQLLGREPYQVTDFDDTYVKGEVYASEDGMLFTTIPYEAGWSVYIDGEKAETEDFYEAFLQIPLTAGNHTVEFRYHVPGQTIGLIISLAALAVFLLLLWMRRKWPPQIVQEDHRPERTQKPSHQTEQSVSPVSARYSPEEELLMVEEKLKEWQQNDTENK